MIETAKTCAKIAWYRLRSNKGQSLVEYALILSFISVLTVALTSILGVQIRGIFVTIVNAIQAARAGV